MHILFLSHYFPPEVNAPASRTFEHCKRWVKSGHEVTVVTCTPNHPRGEVYFGYENKLWQWEERDGVRVLRVWTYLAANEGFVRRTANYVSFMVACLLVAPFLRSCDIVISTSPQFFNGLAGYFVSRMKRVPWLVEIRDLWPESILAVGAIKNTRVIRILEWLARFVYRKADRIVSVTDAFVNCIVECGAEPEKITVIKNGVDLDRFGEAPHASAFRRKAGLEGKFVVSYVGTHGMAHGLEIISQAAEQLRDHPDIVFLMVGDGAEKAQLVAQKENRNLANVVMLDQQPKDMMPYVWAASDVSLVVLRRRDVFKTVIPSKIFESMAMAKPIVLGVEGESADLVNGARAGLLIEPENATRLAEVVLKLARCPELGAELGENGRKFVRNHFDRNKLAHLFEDVLVATVAERQLNRVSQPS